MIHNVIRSLLNDSLHATLGQNLRQRVRHDTDEVKACGVGIVGND